MSNLAVYGLFYNASIQFHLSTWIGFEIGGINFSNYFDTKRLQLNTEAFLAGNNIKYNNVSVISDAYDFNVAYVKLSLGNFAVNHSSLKIEPMSGKAYKGFTRNVMTLQVTYPNSDNQTTQLSFNTKTFLLYGASLKYDLWTLYSNRGVTFSAHYLTGVSMFENQQIQFGNNQDLLTFTNKRDHMASLTIGYQIFLARSKHN